MLDDQAREAQTGTRKARRRLFASLHDMLAPYFRRKVAKQDVEDQIQETLTIVFDELDDFEFREPGSFRRHVFTVAFNRVRVYRFKQVKIERVREREAVGEWAVDQQSSQEESTFWDQRMKKLRLATQRIRTTWAQLVESRLRGESYREFARARGLKLGTVRRYRHEAVKAIRAKLEELNTPEPRY